MANFAGLASDKDGGGQGESVLGHQPGPLADDLAGDNLVVLQLFGVLVEIHDSLADPGLLQPGVVVNSQTCKRTEKLWLYVLAIDQPPT